MGNAARDVQKRQRPGSIIREVNREVVLHPQNRVRILVYKCIWFE